MKKTLILLLILLSLSSLGDVHNDLTISQLRSTEKQILTTFGRYPTIFTEFLPQSERKVRLDRVVCSSGRVNLHFNEGILQIAIREDLCKVWEDQIRSILGSEYSDAKIGIFAKDIPIERYIPNLYRSNLRRDNKRTSTPIATPPLVKPLDKPTYGKGLSYRTLAMWASHGSYMDFEDTTWKFQRPALFGTIEDIHTYFLTDTYLYPMLENSGAVIISPRERDVNPLEFILDNDSNDVTLTGNWSRVSGGFKHIDIIKEDNPFLMGTSLISNGISTATYTTTLDSSGKYAVYVSFKRDNNNSKNALYTVFHRNGQSQFEVNQTIGGGWIYLGKFQFDSIFKITLSGDGQLSTDAIKIGGGMGNVERLGSISGVPRWAEAARYFMQYSGVPSSIYCQQHDKKAFSDYMDDYKSRGDWVNYLRKNLKIPIDLAFALHTNAGRTDSIFGSLTINYTNKGRDNYENGKSKFSGRDFADILLTQLVDDIRFLYDSTWVRRSLYDKSYAEVSRPDVPAVILELLSHQNYTDMMFGLSSDFRFDVCRSIYKGILKFLADRYGLKYEVQPLPVINIKSHVIGDILTLKWSPQIDKLEPTANSQYYKVFTQTNGIWDNGIRVDKPTIDITLPTHLTFFKITAYNDGGSSFDLDHIEFNPVHVNNLTISRLPLLDYSIVGEQFEYDQYAEFVDNNNPGYGATDLSLLFKGILSSY